MTIEEFCREYLEHRKSSIKESTAAVYEATLKKHIIPYIGDMNAESMSRENTVFFYSRLADKGLSDHAVHGVGIFLRSVFNFASKKYGIESGLKQASLPRLRKKNITVLTDEEKRTVLEHGELPARCALLMGLRIGEVCGLMGADIENGVLTVRRTIQRIQANGATAVIITPPKTENSRRQIPVPKQIAEELEAAAADSYIITNSEKPTEPRAIEYRWKQFCNRYGLKNINFHTLRHTFATTAIEAGIDVKTLSEMLGHASVSTTMDLYCHPSLKHKQECMMKIWE